MRERARVSEREREKGNKGEKWKEMFYISYAGAFITVLTFSDTFQKEQVIEFLFRTLKFGYCKS